MNFTSDDQNRGPYDIGFEFPFYDTAFTSIKICTNGWISFTSGVNFYNNTMLPAAGEPNNLIAGYWDDINPTLGGEVYLYTNYTDTAIVSWVEVPRYARTGIFTFEIIITANGNITYQYLAMSGTLNSATIGIENATGTVGSMVSFNEAYVTNSLAVQYRIPLEWLAVAPNFGSNLPDHVFQPTVKFTTAGINEGRYYGHINIRSNDTNDNPIILPCTLQVRPAGIVDDGNSRPQSYSLSQNYPNPFNPSTRIEFSLPQKADLRITVYDILGREIRVLFEGEMEPGTHSVLWDGKDGQGHLASSGIYFYSLKAGDYGETKRMSLLK